MRHQLVSRFSICALGAALLAGGAQAASAASVTLSSTVEESGFNGGTVSEIPLTADGSYLPDVSPWDFTDQDYESLTEIDFISVKLHIGSGDSLAGEVNFNEFTLGLDGFDTGLELNGDWVVTNNGTVFVLETFTGSIDNADNILAALLEDGQLVGTIFDSDPGDDFISLGSTQGAIASTTLVINGLAGDGGNPGGEPGGENPPPGGGVIPTPAAAGAGLMLLAGLVGKRRRDEA